METVGENPIKFEPFFELISVPGAISLASENLSLIVDVNIIVSLNSTLRNNTIQCSPDDIGKIVAVSYLFASQSTNTNGNGTLIVRQEHRRWSWTNLLRP